MKPYTFKNLMTERLESYLCESLSDAMARLGERTGELLSLTAPGAEPAYLLDGGAGVVPVFRLN